MVGGGGHDGVTSAGSQVEARGGWSRWSTPPTVAENTPQETSNDPLGIWPGETATGSRGSVNLPLQDRPLMLRENRPHVQRAFRGFRERLAGHQREGIHQAPRSAAPPHLHVVKCVLPLLEPKERQAGLTAESQRAELRPAHRPSGPRRGPLDHIGKAHAEIQKL